MQSDVSKEVKRVEDNFENWLEVSNFTEKDFLEYRTIAGFEVLGGTDGNYTIVALGRNLNGVFQRIGEQFAFLQGDLSAFEDLSLLLLFIAEKLDSANKKSPLPCEQRKDYFYNKVKEFIVSTEEYKKINASE